MFLAPIIGALILSGCGTQKAMVVKTPVKVQYFAKKSELSANDLQRWSQLDMAKDSIPGLSVDRAYAELLKGKTSTTVIVGVVDSGVDIDHEDLRGKIWTNSKEIPGNGIDDDNNGYIDDVHGWNFLGNSTNENLELTRIVRKGDDGSTTYKQAKAELEEKLAENKQGQTQVNFIMGANKKIETFLNNPNYTLEDLKGINSSDPQISQSKMVMMQVIPQAGPDFHESLNGFAKQMSDMVDYNLNVDFDGRKVVGDNPDDITDTKYGNNNVKGPDVEDALHGTHVAGIIAMIRGNGKGADGIADNAMIMPVRAVPNGDEYDKDIALGIRYAVDNGAKVINGSFGKSYSPHADWVHDALKYAASKDVLVVLAAGNDGTDLDLPDSRTFPNDFDANNKEITDNVIMVGAIGYSYSENIVAPFSNYGATKVDVFAPGMEIYSTVPNNKYLYEQGTSMASPEVAGVAALVRSYYPKLTAVQVKQILKDSGIALDMSTKMAGQDSRPFAKASTSGRIVNAYNALLMAEKMSKK